MGASAAAALLAPSTTATTQTASATATSVDCGVHPQGWSGWSSRWKEGQFGTVDGQIYVCRDGQLVKW
ncbi:hypothetical protein ACNF49_29610 [Actinomadura sp. ATCC 39365]